MDEKSILHRLEAESRARHASIRQMLVDEDREDLVRDLDARTTAIENGTYGAGSTWLALSVAQRRVLLLVLGGNRRLERVAGTRFYDIRSDDGSVIERSARLPTIRNLTDRELLQWDGGAFDPEMAAIVTERGRFVAKHGPSNTKWFSGAD